MSGTAPQPDQGPCEEQACLRPYGHAGEHVIRKCDEPGCFRPTRNSEEAYCTRHEARSTFDKYWPRNTPPGIDKGQSGSA